MTTATPRHIGPSQIPIGRIGLGMAALGRPGYINLGHGADLPLQKNYAAMEAHAHSVLQYAWEQGIRYFDTARSYGAGEAFLSTWLARSKPSEVAIGSKWGYHYTANWQVEAEKHEVKEHSLEKLRQQWQESHSLLGKFLQLYQIHSATFESGVLRNQAVLQELASMKEQGIWVGLSVSGVRQAAVLEKAASIRIEGVRLFDTVQATYNMLENSAGNLLEALHREGMLVIVKEALANGRLTGKPGAQLSPSQNQLLKALAESHQQPVSTVAMAWVLDKPWADVVLSGAATKAQLAENLVAENCLLNPTEIEEIEDTLPEIPADYWEKRGKLPWN